MFTWLAAFVPRVFSSLGILKCLASFMYVDGLLPARFKAEGV